MTDRELRKLGKAELMELLLEQSEEIARLRKQLAEREAALTDRELKLQRAGSIATASLTLTNVFEAAQAAADLYLENVKRLCGETALTQGFSAEWNEFLKQQETAAGPETEAEAGTETTAETETASETETAAETETAPETEAAAETETGTDRQEGSE